MSTPPLITPAATYHDVLTEGLFLTVTGQDPAPLLSAVRTFFQDNARQTGQFGFRGLAIGPSDHWLTVDHMLDLLTPKQADAFVNGLFVTQVQKLAQRFEKEVGGALPPEDGSLHDAVRSLVQGAAITFAGTLPVDPTEDPAPRSKRPKA